jgi:trafficking protein particle complex subunit 8
MSISKRWTPFGGSSSSKSSGPAGSSSSYDPVQGSYRPEAPEALMRKLADFAFMLRDYKLAGSTYELLRSDNEHDKAWKHYAGANEMCLVSTLLHSGSRATFQSTERWLEAATHSYIHRCATPFYALRTLLLASECLRYRGSLGVDEPARWAARVLEVPGLIGPVGTALVQERVASFYGSKAPIAPGLGIGGRRRKSGFWWMLAAEQWVNVGKSVQAERCLDDARAAFTASNRSADAKAPSPPQWMLKTLQESRERIVELKLDAMGDIGLAPDDESGVSSRILGEEVSSEEEVSEELLVPRLHRRSIIGEPGGRLWADAGLDTTPLSPVRTRDKEIVDDEGFE